MLRQVRVGAGIFQCRALGLQLLVSLSKIADTQALSRIYPRRTIDQRFQQRGFACAIGAHDDGAAFCGNAETHV